MKKIGIDERMLIQGYLAQRFNITQIAKMIGVNKSTISREISKYCFIQKSETKGKCSLINKSLVCNYCTKKAYCCFEKKFYNFEEADYKAKIVSRSSRKKTKISKYAIDEINQILLVQVKQLRQSLHHVYVSNPQLQVICSERTIRRLIYRRETIISPADLRKYVVFKHEYEKPKKFLLRDISVIIGRTFKDYINFVKTHKTLNKVQYDSVVGKREDIKAILTITFPKYAFQFGILIYKDNPNDVRNKIKALFRKLGDENVKKIFPINLADNGPEFSYFDEIEMSKNDVRICKTFFTNPYKATDKAHCERYHELIRYFLPKGKSLNNLTQEKINWMFSQINSYVRESKNDRTPYELVKRKFGVSFLNAICIEKVQKKKVSLIQII